MTTAPTVRLVGEWHLVESNGYQVSIAPDATVQLPRHVHARDVPDLCAALAVAADVANDVYQGNVDGARDDDRALAQRNAYVRAGGPPPGAVRMHVAQRQSEQATIGRPSRRGAGGAAAQPATTEQAPLLTRQEKAARARQAAKGEPI